MRKNMGSVSHGAMRPEDLIPAFIDELRYQKPTKREHLKLCREIESRMSQGESTGKQCHCSHYQGEHGTRAINGNACLVCECSKFKVRVGQYMTEYPERETYFDGDEPAEDLDELFNALNEYCLPYFYFGAHPGNGADYGYWLVDDMADDFDGLKVDGLESVPKGYTGEVLDINERGNMTLYKYSHGRKWEVWSVV